MPTVNKIATNAWSQAVTADLDLTLSLVGSGQLEWAVSATATDPTVTGHIIARDDRMGLNEALGRGVVGTGYLYVRTTTKGETIKYAVTTWS